MLYRKGHMTGNGPPVPRRGKGTGANSGPRHRRNSTLADTVRGARTRRCSLWDAWWLSDVYATQPTRSKQRPERQWYARNIGELLLGLGWQSIEETTAWAHCNGGASKAMAPQWADLFAVEFPFAVASGADRFELDVLTVYPGRLEMPTCGKAHRVAVLDHPREDRLRRYKTRPFELICERHCQCYYDKEQPHEGRLYLYQWR